MTTRLLIRTKPRELLPPLDGKYPRINGPVPDMRDVEIFFVDAETGAQTPVANVSGVMIRITPDDVVRAQVDFVDVDLDLEAEKDEPKSTDFQKRYDGLVHYARDLVAQNTELRNHPPMVIQPIPMRIQVLQDARRAVEHIPNQDVLDIIDGLIQKAEEMDTGVPHDGHPVGVTVGESVVLGRAKERT